MSGKHGTVPINHRTRDINVAKYSAKPRAKRFGEAVLDTLLSILPHAVSKDVPNAWVPNRVERLNQAGSELWNSSAVGKN